MAAREDFRPGLTVVHAPRHVATRRGVVVPDPYGACAPEEVPVLFEGRTAFEGVDWRELRLLELD